MEPIATSLESVRARLVKRDEDTPRQFRYTCLGCCDTGVENYLDPENPVAIYARPCKHCAAGEHKLKIWRARTWRGNVDGKSTPYVWKSGTDAEIAEVMAYPCDHDGEILRAVREARILAAKQAQAAPAGSLDPEPEYPEP